MNVSARHGELFDTELGLYRLPEHRQMVKASDPAQGNLSVGLLLELPGSWLVGGEIESAVSSRRKLEGTISPTPNGAGGNILFGHGLGDGRSQVYVFGGIRRMWTEPRSSALSVLKAGWRRESRLLCRISP